MLLKPSIESREQACDARAGAESQVLVYEGGAPVSIFQWTVRCASSCKNGGQNCSSACKYVALAVLMYNERSKTQT